MKRRDWPGHLFNAVSRNGSLSRTTRKRASHEARCRYLCQQDIHTESDHEKLCPESLGVVLAFIERVRTVRPTLFHNCRFVCGEREVNARPNPRLLQSLRVGCHEFRINGSSAGTDSGIKFFQPLRAVLINIPLAHSA